MDSIPAYAAGHPSSILESLSILNHAASSSSLGFDSASFAKQDSSVHILVPLSTPPTFSEVGPQQASSSGSFVFHTIHSAASAFSAQGIDKKRRGSSPPSPSDIPLLKTSHNSSALPQLGLNSSLLAKACAGSLARIPPERARSTHPFPSTPALDAMMICLYFLERLLSLATFINGHMMVLEQIRVIDLSSLAKVFSLLIAPLLFTFQR